MARILEKVKTDNYCSPILRNMTVAQARYIYASAGFATEVNDGRKVKFVEDKLKVRNGN